MYIYLDTNPIMKAMLNVWGGKVEKCYHSDARCVRAGCILLYCASCRHGEEYSQRGPTEWCSKETASWWRLKKREIPLHQQRYIYTAPWMWFKGDILWEYSGSCPVTVQCCTNVFLLCLKRSVLAPVSLRPSLPNTQSALIGQLTHAWPSTANNNWIALLN